MKKALTSVIVLLLTCSAMAAAGKIERLDKKTVKQMTQTQMQDRAEILEERLTEIQTMDLKTLERTERKSLKKEVRYIHREMTALENGGIYLSTGAIIIIVLLLIIIL